MNESIIRDFFKEKRLKIQPDMNDIYAEIADIVKTKPMESVAKEITITEASKLNAYCQNLEQVLRREACEKMAAAGVPLNEVNIIWARAKRKAGTAQIELCKEEKQNIPHQDNQKYHEGKKAEKQESAKGSGTAIFVSGAAMEVIGWVFIPGMGKVAAVIKGIGLVIMAAGAYMVYEGSKESPRIKVSEEIGQQGYGDTRKIIDDICEKQCQLNTSVLCAWLDSLCNALLKECSAGNS